MTDSREIQPLPFSAPEFDRRLRAVRASTQARGWDAVVLNAPENLYYLSGYQSLGYFAYQVLVVPVDAEPCFVVRYGERGNVWGRSSIQDLALWRDTEDPVAVTKTVLERIARGESGSSSSRGSSRRRWPSVWPRPART